MDIIRCLPCGTQRLSGWDLRLKSDEQLGHTLTTSHLQRAVGLHSHAVRSPKTGSARQASTCHAVRPPKTGSARRASRWLRCAAVRLFNGVLTACFSAAGHAGRSLKVPGRGDT